MLDYDVIANQCAHHSSAPSRNDVVDVTRNAVQFFIQ